MLGNEVDRPLMVSVRCATYNHVNFIRQCLDGFVMQKTTFRFEVIVHDDASTDGTTDIVREYAEKYPEIIKPMYEATNQYSLDLKGMNARINARLTGKYIAICEGDDFWVDPLKLQKEFDFLENNPDKALVYTNCNVFFHKEGVLHKDVFTTGYFKPTKGYKDFLLEGNYIAPCSWLCRRKEREKIEMPSETKDPSLCIAFVFFINNKVGYINDTTCTYRVVHGSASHNNNVETRYKYFLGAFDSETYYLNLYKEFFNDEDRKILYNRRYKQILPFAIALNDREMVKIIQRESSVKLNWKHYVMLFFNRSPMFRAVLYRLLEKKIQKGL